MPRHLEGPELAAYAAVCPPSRLARVRVVRVAWLPAGAAGMTFGTVVLLRHDDDRTGGRLLLAHELVHVRQFGEQGRTRFLARYLADYARNLARLRRHRAAYLAIGFEEEARAQACRWAGDRGTAPLSAPPG